MCDIEICISPHTLSALEGVHMAQCHCTNNARVAMQNNEQ